MIYNTIIIGEDYGTFILKLTKLTDNFTKSVNKQSFIDIIPDSANHGVRSKK